MGGKKNCGNQKIVAMTLQKLRGGGGNVAIDLWQWNCRNRRKKKIVAPKIGVNKLINSSLLIIFNKT